MKVSCRVYEIRKSAPNTICVYVLYNYQGSSKEDFVAFSDSEFSEMRKEDLIKELVKVIKRRISLEREINQKDKNVDEKIKEFKNIKFEFEMEE